ncbi:MAG TPA: alkaline phosphatase family protein [Chthoniobacterales bacterium]
MKQGWLKPLFLSLATAGLAGGVTPGQSEPAQAVDAFPADLRCKVKYVIVIYPENRSFDSLYGEFAGANGIGESAAENYRQNAPDGTPYKKLPQPNTNGIPGISTAPDSRFPTQLENAPFRIDPNVPVNARHGDLVHRFYTEQYQINNPAYRVGADPKNAGGAPMSKFSAYSSNPGLVLGRYDAQYLGEGGLAHAFTLCDNAFHSAFGGSFLNHQWLVSARSPIWPAQPSEGAPPSASSATIFDENGFPAATTKGVPSDGTLTDDPNLPGFADSNTDRSLQDGDYWAVNTVYPLRGPAGGYNTISPAPPPPGPITQPTVPTFDTPTTARLPLQRHDTIGDRLSAKNISWAWFAGGWDEAKAGRANYLFQFHHQPFAFFSNYALARTPVPATADHPAEPGVDSPGSKAHLKDIDDDFFKALGDGTLPNVSFLKPIGEVNAHPGYSTVQDGADWIRTTVGKIQASKYWNECAIFIMYDEHGGLWDHVTPPVVDDWGPGLRVPLTVVSPFAKNGFVDHTQYETVSLLKFIEGVYDLPPLNRRDAEALAPISAFQGYPDLVIKARQGRSFDYQLPAYNGPQFYVGIGDGDGLWLDPLSGALSGSPERAGRFDFLVFADGRKGPVYYVAQLQVTPAAGGR